MTKNSIVNKSANWQLRKFVELLTDTQRTSIDEWKISEKDFQDLHLYHLMQKPVLPTLRISLQMREKDKFKIEFPLSRMGHFDFLQM